MIQHSEPLIIIGTDILMRARTGWTFSYVGIHPKTHVGVMIFHQGNEETTVELVTWPKTAVQLPPLAMKKPIPAKETKSAEFNSTTVTTATDLLALIRQGQCVQRRRR